MGRQKLSRKMSLRLLGILLTTIGFVALCPSCHAQTLNCTAPGDAFSIVEKQCAPGVLSRWHYFEVTLSGGSADEIYTSIISPSNASCSGSGSQFQCAPSHGPSAGYLAMVGQGCAPDELNNNWADLTPRFSKHVTICKPCSAGSYWLAFKLLRMDMACDIKVFAPRGSKQSSSAGSCTITSRTSSGGAVEESACATGLQRAPLDPVIEEECPLPDGLACLFGICTEWVWLVVSLGVGLVPTCCMGVVTCVFRRKWKREEAVEEEDLLYAEAAQGPQYINTNDVVVQDLNTATLAKELDSDAEDGDLPDQLPPTFYVNDRYDDN